MHILLWALLYRLALLLVAIGALFLLALYVRGAFGPKVAYRFRDAPEADDPRFALVLACLSRSQLTRGRSEGFYVGADEIYAARLRAVADARESVRFETFFFTPGRRADAFADVLCARARAGVTVQLIIDRSGARPVPRDYWTRLRNAGIEVRFYNPFAWRNPFAYLERTHRKLLVVDGRVALLGGAGISDHWDGKPSIGDRAPWLDVEIELGGPIVSVLEAVFMEQWAAAGGVADLRICRDAEDSPHGHTMLVTPGDSPSDHASPMRALFSALIAAARQRVWIASPYFLPDRAWRHVLVATRQRGVDVRVLNNGPCVDMPLVYMASRELYTELLAGGIKLYEYQPAMMHAKLLLVDDCWASVGSANFDPRSFFHNEELNVSTCEPGVCRAVEEVFLGAFERARVVTHRDWRRRPASERVYGRLALIFRSYL